MTSSDSPFSVDSPLHEHSLEKYFNDAHWRCIVCSVSKDNIKDIYRCGRCDFNICEKCALPVIHPRHPGHDMYLTPASQIDPNCTQIDLKCGGCEKVTSSKEVYHCFDDEFNLCKQCFDGHDLSVHTHLLKPVDAVKIYNETPGWWYCDCCKRQGEIINLRYSWHCGQCQFDCCNDCLRGVKVASHAHPLKLIDPMRPYSEYQGRWSCDRCLYTFEPTNFPYHCEMCEYDICRSCYSRMQDPPIDPIGPPGFVPFPPRKEIEQLTEKFEELNNIDDDDVDIESLDDSEKCVICFSKRKSATIVHGSTGHVCCCLSCAYKLKAENSKCPICKANIDQVIRHYND